MHDVITIGSATLDVFLCCMNLDILEHEGQKEVAFPYGSKINVDNVIFETGGGGTNTATTFARQGLSVAVVGKIGKDFPGEKVISRLVKENIDTHYLVKSENNPTDFATIIWAPNKGSVILINRGKGKLEISDIAWNNLRTKWFFVSSIEGNLEILNKIRKICSSTETNSQYISSSEYDKPKIAWNPGIRELKQKNELIDLLGCVELLILNKKEANLLISNKLENPPEEDIQPLLKQIQALSSNKKLITAGHNGSYYFNGNKWIHAGIFEVDRREATGAGDAFGSAFVAGLIRGMNDKECLKLASANASSVVQSPGAKEGILKKENNQDWLNKELYITELPK